MKVLCLEQELGESTAADFASHLAAEARRLLDAAAEVVGSRSK
jgi:hypothetical protein